MYFRIHYNQTLLILILNVIVFFTFFFSSGFNSNLPLYFSAWKYETGLFVPYQLISYQFVHASTDHLLLNLFIFVPTSIYLESIIKNRLLYYFLCCGIIAGVFHLLMYNDNLPLVGASGSIWGLIVILALIQKSIFFRTFILLSFLLEILSAITTTGDGIAHWCHIGGALGGLLIFFFEKVFYKVNQDS